MLIAAHFDLICERIAVKGAKRIDAEQNDGSRMTKLYKILYETNSGIHAIYKWGPNCSRHYKENSGVFFWHR